MRPSGGHGQRSRCAFGAAPRRSRSAHPTQGVPLNAPTAFEQLSFLHPPEPGEALTPLGIPGFAGFFLSLLEEDGWAVSITRAFAGDAGDFLIVAARGDDHVQASGAPANAAVDVFRQARELHHIRRRDTA
jgi:hypothetical protein